MPKPKKSARKKTVAKKTEKSVFETMRENLSCALGKHEWEEMERGSRIRDSCGHYYHYRVCKHCGKIEVEEKIVPTLDYTIFKQVQEEEKKETKAKEKKTKKTTKKTKKKKS